MHHHDTDRSRTAARHPLDPLGPADIDAARQLLEDGGLLTGSWRVSVILPDEPTKAELTSWSPGKPFDRRIEATLLDTADGSVLEAVVSITRGAIDTTREVDPSQAPYGQPKFLYQEFERAEELAKTSPEWRAAMTRRGLANRIDLAFCPALAPGFTGREDEIGRRVVRALTFLRDAEDDSPWAHPVEGLIVHIDLIADAVIRVEDHGDVPVPAAGGNYTTEATGPARTTLRPIDILQPEGPSYRIDGPAVSWEGWSMRVDFNAREGLVLHDVRFHDRQVLSRASIPEMVVPYGDTSPSRFWISYFDAGEYLLGSGANPLELGCDCVGTIHYFDGYVTDDLGHPRLIPNAICLHEEDAGIQWKHTEHGPIGAQSRRGRRLVVSYFSTIGNYDYGFFWYFHLDGSIQVETKATGIVFAGAGEPGGSNPHAPEIAPAVFAPVHQHLFCARLDVAIDGEDNRVVEVDAVRIPMGEDNPFGNAFTWSETVLATESSAQRQADTSTARVWEVQSASHTNRVGKPTAYHLIPQPTALLLADDASTVAARAAFATRHLWVTAYDREQRWPAGRYPNAHQGGAGLPEYTAADRSVDGEDIVLWHTFGLTHIPRPEDWPIMPVDCTGFWFKPYGFLDENPTLDLPVSSAVHATHECSCTHGSCACPPAS